MVGIAIAVFTLLVLLVVLLAAGTAVFLFLLNSTRKIPPDEELPRAAVVMSVRGNDPSLDESITTLLHQDYPDYLLQIVVDSIDDPAWEPIQRIVKASAATHVNVLPLTEHYETCSLKCSALVQGISALDPSYEAIAIVDADMIAYPNWLRELVSPLQDPKVGITSGTRWYMPEDDRYGSWVRYIWNVSGAVCMYLYRCPWGGSMAIRRSLFYEGGLLETWKTVLSDDNTASNAAHRMGLTLNYVPTLILVNREACDLAGCWRFVRRQFLWTKLYSPFWNIVFLQAISPVVYLTICTVGSFMAMAQGNREALLWFVSGIGLYSVSCSLMILLLERKARAVVRHRESLDSSLWRVVKAIAALPLAHILSAFGVLAVLGMKQVEWRGVTYEIKNPLKVKLIKYLPYRRTERARALQDSIL